ncbi:methylated-DNA--[protein]-cysteine S-methyltransferase [Epibacterium sp. SM1969]|uniref:Methylated-DNA--[protein]-cysteine S-methyltransferase n=1 Tax=Tritonibacter aquimaris TaxID=2663379 RepID=A0A844ATF4_9RHOB|nr:methylated-DNA--[protein]-cysteine S-methyltransferase [Tritonibacter aquimaris]MQY43057.1 methylated-DNA--[protein]-cysteine S-methyltransferase [Tritonibacter aquimaris]
MTAEREQYRVASVATPVGQLYLSETDGFIHRLDWQGQERGRSAELAEGVAQITRYFAGQLQEFDLPLKLSGSSFQQRVQQLMLDIPFGETRTYGDLAQEIGGAAQPVGNACGANALPLLVPCHRVLGRNGLGGYSGAGGVETKVALLRHEGAAGLLI